MIRNMSGDSQDVGDHEGDDVDDDDDADAYDDDSQLDQLDFRRTG